MTNQEALTLLGNSVTETGLYDLGWYLCANKGDSAATLDGIFTADQLEAIAIYMRTNPEKVELTSEYRIVDGQRRVTDQDGNIWESVED